MLSEEHRQYLGAKVQTMQPSDTLVKQLPQRNDTLSLADYRLVQPTLQEAVLIVNDQPNHLLLFRRNGKYFKALVKVTRGGDKLLLQSFRPSSADEIVDAAADAK